MTALDIEKERDACADHFKGEWPMMIPNAQRYAFRGWLAAKRAAQPVASGGDGLIMPILPQTLINLIGEYGYARYDGKSEVEITHRWKALIAGIKEYAAQQVKAAGQRGEDARAHGHCEDYYLMANARRITEEPIRLVRAMPNWQFASELFATGSNSAHQICIDAGIDPDGCKVERAAIAAKQGGA